MSPSPRAPAGQVAVTVEGTTGRASRDRHGWEVSLAAGTGRLDVATATRLLVALDVAIATAGGGPARWRVPSATREHHRIAGAARYRGDRRLVQMRCDLPLPWRSAVETRPFVAGGDEDEWLRVNNAAFHWHPEQGGWTVDELNERIAEPWFDPGGFLLHPRDGRIDGFCWTKVHHELEPPLGEIYVIAVDPPAAGRGLGRELVLAGLDHLADLGLSTAMLYTEADNEPARVLYDRLGFTVHHEVTVFERDVEPRRSDPHGSDPDGSDPDTDD